MTDGTHDDEVKTDTVSQSDLLEKLKEMTAAQCSDGNWDYDPYMHGMANGMLFAVSCMENKTPEYLTAPDVWLRDKHMCGRPVPANKVFLQ